MPTRTLILVLIGVAALVVAPLGQGNYILYVLSSWLIFSIAAMGLNLTLGYAGQVSLAQAAFMGIGAYTTAIMTMAGVHWIVAAPCAMLLCFVVGLVLGYPALRVQHHFLAFVTLAFNTLVFLVLRNEDWLTGGSLGLAGIMRPSFFGVSTRCRTSASTTSPSSSSWSPPSRSGGMVHSPWGRAFKALRENPVRANSLGVDIRLITLLAFAIGSAMGGLAGALAAPLVQFIDPPAFSLVHSLRLLLMVVVGGAGFYFGPILGAGARHPAAGVPAGHRRVLPDDLRRLGHGADDLLPVGHHRPLPEGRRPLARPAGPRRPPAGSAAVNAMTPVATKPVLSVRDVSKTFGAIKAVQGVTFDVYPGEILGLIGPNGSGKSTLFNCILGQYPPTAGEVVHQRQLRRRQARLRPQQARDRPHLPAALGLPEDDRARQHHPRRPGAQGQHALAPLRAFATPA